MRLFLVLLGLTIGGQAFRILTKSFTQYNHKNNGTPFATSKNSSVEQEPQSRPLTPNSNASSDDHRHHHHRKNEIRLRNPFSKILLMGHFNCDTVPVDVFQRWIAKMELVFGKVLVRGAFFNTTRLNELRAVGLDVELANTTIVHGSSRDGFVTPYNNLKNVLLDCHGPRKSCRPSSKSTSSSTQQLDGDDDGIFDGVLYIHDDSLLNLPVLAKHFETSTQRQSTIVGTDIGKPGLRNAKQDASYEDPRRPPLQSDDDHSTNLSTTNNFTRDLELWTTRIRKTTYRIYAKNDTHPFADFEGKSPTKTMNELNAQVLDAWNMRTHRDGRCMGGHYKLTMDSRAQKYYEAEGRDDNPYMLFPQYTQADFLYVPIRYAQEFAELADLMEEHRIWLECAIPSIVDQLRHVYNATVSVVPLCTAWGGRRGKPGLVNLCRGQEKGDFQNAVYHPIKPGVYMNDWERLFDVINGDWMGTALG